ncbi:MAG: PQQ-binding-like beta-propeller repeat protein [Planctomycetes bacterium]|nr:PQQ-binding-like beta-propeller repeat protein [Planctomycetota bacterium]
MKSCVVRQKGLAAFRRSRRVGTLCGGIFVLFSFLGLSSLGLAEQRQAPLTIAVMDPLAAPLSCACVEGYAQRDYDKLAVFLQNRLGRKVTVLYVEALQRALPAKPGDRLDLIIGKRALAEYDAAECRLSIRPIATLTDKRGKTTLTGLFVVGRTDPAQRLSDLKGYRIIFGPKDSAEKHQAAMDALRQEGISVPQATEIAPDCNEAALRVLENEGRTRVAAVISSYAQPLLEGCGTIDPGALRVVGQTAAVPFVTVFATASVSAEDRSAILAALEAVRKDRALLKALESRAGFVPLRKESAPTSRQTEHSAPEASKHDRAPDRSAPANRVPAEPMIGSNKEWPQWRGPARNGLIDWLPKRLSPRPNMLWKKKLTGDGLAGIVGTEHVVIVSDRDDARQRDIFRCLDARTGRQLWQLSYSAPGDLDYGNSPRATPLIHDGRVYLLGAFGDLHCVRLDDGRVLWKRQLIREFRSELVTWGLTSSPLLVDGRLIVNPGAETASLVALEASTGKTVWRCPGFPSAYASFFVGEFGGRRQIVGYDQISLGGWDATTGKRLWSLIPPEEGDFNVPSPLRVGGQLLVASENNGTRLYGFRRDGTIIARPTAKNDDLLPDSTSPVVMDGKVYGCSGELFCLDLREALRTVWRAADRAFEDHVSILAGDSRLLIASADGELLLVDVSKGRYRLVSRLRVFDDEAGLLSHPALIGNRLYLRSKSSICCLELARD